MLKKVVCIFVISLLLLITLSAIPCQGAIEEYSLEIEVTLSAYPLLAYQSVTPIDVNVELTNIGNNSFSGTLTIEGKTEENRRYGPRSYPISNLTNEKPHGYAMLGVRTDDIGTYWFTVTIESNQTVSFGNIKLYKGSVLIDENYNQVSITKSIFLRSFAEFLTILGIVIGAIVSISIAIYAKRK
jgi:hypothetical protein